MDGVQKDISPTSENGNDPTKTTKNVDTVNQVSGIEKHESQAIQEKFKQYLVAQKKKRQEEEKEYLEEKKKKFEEEESLYLSNQSLFMAGAVGGVGSVCIKLLGEENNLSSEITQNTETEKATIDFLPFELSDVSFGLGLELVIYLGVSIFLGALSGFILISMGGISTRIDNRRRCLASCILFGLFFPSSIQLMKQNVDSQVKIESQQKEVQELKVKEETLSQKNVALREESKDAIATLTRTEDVQANPELKQKVLEGYIDIFRNVDETSEQEDLLTNISDVGKSNTTQNTTITQKAVDFLESVSTDEKYETSIQNTADQKVAEIRAKCELEQVNCG